MIMPEFQSFNECFKSVFPSLILIQFWKSIETRKLALVRT